jgi:hypothetical protein
MRTYFEIEEVGDYLGARDLLVRRCEAWAAANGLGMSPVLAGTLLDSRHFSSDGRLGYWTPEQVRRALLDWIAGKVTAPDEVLLEAPETLRTLLGYLNAHGLRDPRGAATAQNEAAIDAAAKELPGAIRDEDRYGMAKTVAMSARDHGADIGDPDAVTGFLEDVQAGRVVLDEDLLERAARRRGDEAMERKFAQLPVRLPPALELAAAAGRSTVVGQLRAFTEWLGPDGRPLTAAGNIRPVDARELVVLLGTGDEGLRFRSATELPGLNLIVNWAKKARLVRRQGTRLVPVAKARPLLGNAETLWQRAFDSVFDLGDAVCRPLWADAPPSPVQRLFDVIVPDVMAAIYSMQEPAPVAGLADSVWETIRAHFVVNSLSPPAQTSLRGEADNDVRRIFDAFESLGAVISAPGRPGSLGESGAGGEPGCLVSLTPLGTRAMRQRMLAEGREAGLVGELVNASAAEVLGTVAEHYTPASAAEEITGWRDAHGGSLNPGSLEPFVQAIRECPFLSRKVALLKTLAGAVPEGEEMLANLLTDPELGPVVLFARKGDRGPDEVAPEEAPWLMAANMLQFLELGGPDAVREQLGKLRRAAREDFVLAVSESGYPARETLEEFRTLVAEPILSRKAPSGPPHLRVVRTQPVKRTLSKRHRRR